MSQEKVRQSAEKVFKELKKRVYQISTAESCTGGMVASALVSLEGISDYFPEGLITYSNESKIKRLGVKRETIEKFGAVSRKTVREMLLGLETDTAIAISGIAGPGGGTAEKPVGTVFIGVMVKDRIRVERKLFSGSRDDVREKSSIFALEALLDELD